MDTLKIAFLGNYCPEFLYHLKLKYDLRLIVGGEKKPKAGLKNSLKKLKRSLLNERSLLDVADQLDVLYVEFSAYTQQELSELIRSKDIDVLLVMGASKLDSCLISASRKYSMNIHFSDLPHYYGGNPLFWQVKDGVEKSAVTVFELTDKIDEGRILGKRSVSFPADSVKQNIIALFEKEAAVVVHEVLESVRTDSLKVEPAASTENIACARNIKREMLSNLFSLASTDVDELYRVARYFGFWPHEISPIPGLSKYIPWVVVDKVKPPEDPNLAGTVDNVPLLKLHLHCHDGDIVMRPSLNPLAWLRHLRYVNSFAKGKNQYEYI